VEQQAKLWMRFPETVQNLVCEPGTIGGKMGDRFSPEELYALRNFIPIDTLIQKLAIEHLHRDGFLRFQCPICLGFHTATKKETNLGRCFTCRRNFNTIDLAMICEKQSFVDSVQFLKRLRDE
jgi:hypothetical protein